VNCVSFDIGDECGAYPSIVMIGIDRYSEFLYERLQPGCLSDDFKLLQSAMQHPLQCEFVVFKFPGCVILSSFLDV
jgi:hypothetical protein